MYIVKGNLVVFGCDMFSRLRSIGVQQSILRIGTLPRLCRNLFIQTLPTPNEQALKFLPSMQLLAENETREFLSGREAASSPLVFKLFAIDGIRLVMVGHNFITIEKSEADWSILKPEIFSVLTEYLSSGAPVIMEENDLSDDVKINEDDSETVTLIKELIFTRIRPAIQEDGGDIEFVSFEESGGKVFLRLKGACRSCDSSAVTLRNGIENMLKHYIEEVQMVEQVTDTENNVVDTLEAINKEPSTDESLSHAIK